MKWRFVILSKAKPHAAPSSRPPKKWYYRMEKQIRASNPDYSDEQVSATVGSIWYKRMSVKERKSKRAAEGKTCKKRPGENLTKAKHDPIQATILAFLQQNPNPSDKQVHKLADSLELDPSELEEKVYEILGSFASSGRAKARGITEKDVGAKELAMGVKVEMEHTTSSIMAKRIALDHLAEDTSYYSKLKKMEKSKRIYIRPTAGRKGYYREDPREKKSVEQKNLEAAAALQGIGVAPHEVKPSPLIMSKHLIEKGNFGVLSGVIWTVQQEHGFSDTYTSGSVLVLGHNLLRVSVHDRNSGRRAVYDVNTETGVMTGGPTKRQKKKE